MECYKGIAGCDLCMHISHALQPQRQSLLSHAKMAMQCPVCFLCLAIHTSAKASSTRTAKRVTVESRSKCTWQCQVKMAEPAKHHFPPLRGGRQLQLPETDTCYQHPAVSIVPQEVSWPANSKINSELLGSVCEACAVWFK